MQLQIIIRNRNKRNDFEISKPAELLPTLKLKKLLFLDHFDMDSVLLMGKSRESSGLTLSHDGHDFSTPCQLLKFNVMA